MMSINPRIAASILRHVPAIIRAAEQCPGYVQDVRSRHAVAQTLRALGYLRRRTASPQ